jgi:AAA family ATP:ADP antiporter
MFLYIFAALTAYYILKPLRSGLFLSNLPSNRLVYAYWLSALLAGTLVTPLFRIGRRVSAITLITVTNLLFIATLFYFRWAIGRDFGLLPYVYYVYVQIAPVLVVAQFWLLAGYVYDNRQAKRLFGLLGAGASAGSLMGSIVVQNFRRTLGIGWLLILCVGICAGLIVVSRLVWRRRRRDPALQAEQRRLGAESEKLSDLLATVFGSRHLRLIALLILLTMITSQLADWQINDAVQRTFSGLPENRQQARIDEFFAGFNFYTNLVGIALQVVATGFVVRRLGIWAATLFLPVAVFGSSIGVLLVPALLTAVIVEGSDSVFRYSLNRAGLELLYLPLSPEVRKKIKLFIDVFIDRVGRALAGVIVFAVTRQYLPLGLRGTAVAILVLSGVSIYVCIRLRKTYVGAFQQQLARRELDLSEARSVTDRGTVVLLLDALKSSQERQILFALGLLQSVEGADFSERLLPLLAHPTPHVRAGAVRALSASPGDFSAEIAPMLSDVSEDVVRAAVGYLCSRATGARASLIHSLLEHQQTSVGLAAADWLSEHEVRGVSLSSQFVQQLASARNETDAGTKRQIAARLTAKLPPADSVAILRALLRDPDPKVSARAALAAGAAGHMALLFDVAGLLPYRRLRPAAREALLKYGPDIAGTLGDLLADQKRGISLRRELPWVLGRMPTNRAAAALVEHLDVQDPLLKYRVVKALNRIHARQPDLPPPNPAIAGRVYSETRAYYEALVLWQAFETNGPAGTRTLLSRALRERLDLNLELIFRLLGLRYKQQDIYNAYEALRGTRADRRASALEFLENVLHKDLKAIILPLIEEPSAERLISRAGSLFGIQSVRREEALRIIVQQKDVWLKACALHEIGRECLLDLRDVCRNLSNDSEPLIRETAVWALEQCA